MRKESVFSLKSTSNSDLMNTKEIVSRDSISKLDKTVINVETELEDKPYLEPWAWISLSIICSIIYAISNVVKSEISQYGFMARCLQAPGNLVTNFSTAVFISFYYKTSDEEKGLLHNDDKNTNSSYFKWVYEIFYELPMSKSYLKSDDTENFNTNQPINNSSDKEVSKISWSKTCVFFGIVFVNMFSYWTFIESYKQAISIEMNVGILTSLLSLKPALIAFFFWLLFHQKLRWVDILGIFLLICSIILMSLKLDIYDSESDLAKANSITTKVVISTMIQQNNRDEVVGRLSAISLMILTVVLLMLGNLGFKYLSKEANIVSVNNLSNLIVSIPFFIVLVCGFSLTDENGNFNIHSTEYEWWEIGVGILGGCFNYVSGLLQPYIVSNGKAGPSDAIMQTSTILLVAADIMIYSRVPTTTQFISLGIFLFALLMIAFGSKGH